jgi:carbonic anhydrase
VLNRLAVARLKGISKQIQNVKAYPCVPRHISDRSFVYDVKTGRLKEVAEAHTAYSRA